MAPLRTALIMLILTATVMLPPTTRLDMAMDTARGMVRTNLRPP